MIAPGGWLSQSLRVLLGLSLGLRLGFCIDLGIALAIIYYSLIGFNLSR